MIAKEHVAIAAQKEYGLACLQLGKSYISTDENQAVWALKKEETHSNMFWSICKQYCEFYLVGLVIPILPEYPALGEAKERMVIKDRCSIWWNIGPEHASLRKDNLDTSCSNYIERFSYLTPKCVHLWIEFDTIWSSWHSSTSV